MKLKRFVAGIMLLGLLSLPTSLISQETTQSAPQANRRGARDKDDRNERHPEIRKAIVQLQRAKEDLQHAAHDFGGHRVAALKACDEAIEQLQQALQYDQK